VRILHISDTHGEMSMLRGQFDLVVHSGDLQPNRTRGSVTEGAFQEHWVRSNATRLRHWLGDTPFLFCPGNHDFFDPQEIARDVGIDWTTLGNKAHEVEGLRFVGLPYVPFFRGEWNYETCSIELMRKTYRLLESTKPDVLVAHCPPHGILDDTHGTHIGNRALTEWLKTRSTLKAILCGHCHESAALETFQGCTVSNAARMQRIIKL